MKQLITWTLLFCVSSFLKAQQYNDQFPLGHYAGQSDSRGFFEINSLNLYVIDEHQAHLVVGFSLDLFGDQETIPSLEYQLKYELRNDTLYFVNHNDSIPYLIYYTADDLVSAADGNVRLNIQYSTMFTTEEITVRPANKEASIPDPDKKDETFDALTDITIQANAGDTLWIETSMGGYGFLIPANVKQLYLVPNKPNLGFNCAYKGESANELRFNTMFSEYTFPVFYKGTVPDSLQTKISEDISAENKTFVPVCKSIPPPALINVSVFEYDEEDYDEEDYNEEMYENRTTSPKDTIRYVYDYKEALKIAREENLFIRVLYTKGGSCMKKYLEEIHKLNKDEYYYDSEYRQLLSCVLVFLTEKDEKLVQRLGVTQLNTDFILSSDEVFLYEKQINCGKYQSASFFSSEEPYLMEELRFVYLDKVVVPQLKKNPNDTKALKRFLDGIVQISSTIDNFSYDRPWDVYISGRSSYFKQVEVERIASVGTIFSYLNQYTEAKMDAPLDTSLVKMIISFYNIIYDEDIYVPLSIAPIRYLAKHAGVLEQVDISKNYKYGTLPQLITRRLMKGNNTYTNEEIVNLYKEVMRIFPEYTDYFYLFAYQTLDLSAVSPGFYMQLLAFYKAYLLKLQDIPDWNAHLRLVKDQIGVFETEYRYQYVHEPEKLYKMLSHLAWIVGVHEGRDGEHTSLALRCAQIASEQSVDYDDNWYITPTYAALLYLLDEKEKAISIQKGYCEDKMNSCLEYDQKMIYRLKAMKQGLYEPKNEIKNRW